MNHKKNIVVLILSLTLLIALLLGLGLSQIRQYNAITEITTKLHTYPYTVIHRSQKIHNNIIKMHQGMDDIILANSDQKLETAFTYVDSLEQETLKDFETIHLYALDNHLLVDQIQKKFERFRPIRHEIYKLVKKGDKSEAATIVKHEAASLVTILIENIDTLITSTDQSALALIDQTLTQTQTAQNQLIYLLSALMLFALIITLLVTRHIYKLFRTIDMKNLELKQSNEMLANQTSELNQAQHIAKIGSWRLNHTTGKLHWSDETFAIFGLNPTQEPFTYEAFLSHIHPDDKEHVNEVYTQSILNRTPYEVDHRILFEDGTIKYVREKSETVYTPDGRPLVSVGSIQDLSAEIREKEERKAQARLSQMSEMLTMIAHQWRQPLTSIGVVASDLKIRIALGTLNEVNLEEKADNIIKYTNELSSTIADFQNCFKPTSKETHFHLDETIQTTLKLFDGLFKSEDITIVKEMSHLNPITNYENEIIQVILNIFNNAIDAIQASVPRQGIITIKLTLEDNQQVLRIFDNAGGIAPQYLDQIFEPYFSTKAKNGTGLGLYMSKIIIEEHCKGQMGAINTDQGACFMLSFPPSVTS